jgi:hypothetical protein
MSSWCVGARAVRSGRSILTPFGRLASEAGGVREIELHAGPVPRGDVGEGAPARRGLVGARSGSVTASQRFGGSANLNMHFHSLAFDGVYTRLTPAARPRFHRLPSPTAAIAPPLPRLHRRVRRLLARGGELPAADAGSDPFAAREPRSPRRWRPRSRGGFEE